MQILTLFQKVMKIQGLTPYKMAQKLGITEARGYRMSKGVRTIEPALTLKLLQLSGRPVEEWGALCEQGEEGKE